MTNKKNRKIENEEIMTPEDARPYLRAEDIKAIAIKTGIAVNNVQAAVAGRTKRSCAAGLIIEVGKIRKEEASKMAKEIVSN